MERVTRREWRWVVICALAVMTLTTVPYLVALASQTADWRFSGFLIGVQDGNSYLAKMGQGARGMWLFTLPYSSEPQHGAFIYIFYLLLGKLAGPQTAAQIIAFHLARFVFGAALLLVSYRFLAEFLPFVRQRRLGLLLVALGGGLGWLLTLLGQAPWLGSLPVDFYSPEAFSFLILYSLPHLAAARCLFLLALLAHLRGRPGWAGLALFGVSLLQPMYVPVAWGIIGGHLLVEWKAGAGGKGQGAGGAQLATRNLKLATLNLGLIFLLSSPLVLYTFFLLIADPFFRQWTVQNILPSPHPLHYLLGYGLWLLPAAWGWRILQQRAAQLARFVAVWAVAAPFLAYAPITTQRRLIEGLQLPLVALAVLGLTVAWRRGQRWLVPLTLGASLLTSLMLLLGGALAARGLAEPVFLPADQLAVFQWLTEHAPPEQVGLAAFETGNALPAYTPLVAYIGHGPETVFLAQKAPRVAAFYQSGTSDAERQQLLSDGRITYVLFGPRERALGDFDPARAPYLRWEFAAGVYAVYTIVH